MIDCFVLLLFFLVYNKRLPMLPEIKYYSFDKPSGKINCDMVVSIIVSSISITCVISYFIYLALR